MSEGTCPICGCPQQLWLTTVEVGHALRCDPRTIRNMVADGRLAGVQVGAVWRIRHASVDALVRTARVNALRA